jgi:hypothetical protein
VSRWHAKRDPGGFDLPLGAHQPLRHRALRYQEGTGDLVGAEPAEGAQGERNLRLDRQRRVAAGEQNAAPFLAEDPFERCYQYTSEGRISTAPP